MNWRWALAVGVIVSYNTWLAAPLLNPNPRALSGYLSELAATNQPYHWFFRAGDAVTALLVGLIAWLVWRAGDQWLGRAKRWLVASLALVGVATLADIIFAMGCTPSFDAACKTAEQTNPFELNTFVHALASSLVGLGLLGSFAAVWFARRAAGDRYQVTVVTVWGLVVGLMMLGTVVIAYTVGIGHGYLQLVQVFASSLWFGWLALQTRPATT